MATLFMGTQSVTVPDAVADSYLAEGWSDGAVIADPAVEVLDNPKPKRSRAKKSKAADDGVPIRTEPDAGAPEASS